MLKRKSFGKRALAGGMAAALAFGGGLPMPGMILKTQAASQPALTVDFTETTGDIIHGAAGFLYGVSSEDVPTTNTMVPLKPKVLCTKGALGTEHPYGDALDVAKTFLESGGEQVMMYNSNYYGVFGVTANYKEYSDVLQNTIAPAVVEWKEEWKKEHKDDNLKDIDIDKAIVYIPINEGTPIMGTDTNTAWKSYYEAIKAGDPNATIAGPNSAAYNTQFSGGITMKSHIQYCADNNCMPDVITWHDLQVDKLERLSGEIHDFKTNWNLTDWSRYNKANGTEGIPEIPQICINEYADFSDCGSPGRLVNWIARLEDEKVYGCLPFWHQANNLNDLTADANEGNGAWWVYKWYGDMSGQTAKVSTTTSYEKLYGVASIDDEKKSATVLLGGVDGSANVNLKNVAAAEAFKDAELVHVKVQATAFTGYHGAQENTPTVMEGAFPVNNDGSVTLSLKNMKFSTAYNVTVTNAAEGEEVTDAMVNVYQKVYEAEDGVYTDCNVKEEDNYNPRYYLSAGKAIQMPKNGRLTYQIEVPVDGKYKLDFIYGNGTGSSRNDAENHNPKNVIQNYSIDDQEPQNITMKSTLLENMTGISTLYADLSAGSHTVTIETMEDGYVSHDALTVTWYGAKDDTVKSFNNRYEAEQADFNRLLGSRESSVRTENQLTGYSGNGYVTGLQEKSVPQGGGIRYSVVVEESGLYNITLRYQNQSSVNGNAHIYVGNTTTTLDRLVQTLELSEKAGEWADVTASVYLQKGINIVDLDTDCETALDYMQVMAVQADENYTSIEAEDCIPDGSAIQTAQSAGASGGSYVVGMEGDKNAAEDINKYLEITYTASAAGTYQMRIFQSNNDICGEHSYNTKIIDKYASVQVNEEEPVRYFFINTFSDDTFKEKTITVNLKQGENKIKIFNDDSWQVLWGGSTSTPGTNELDNYAPNFDRFILSPITLEKPIEVPEEYAIDVTATSSGYATVDKNTTEKGGSFHVTMIPEKGIEEVMVNGTSMLKEIIENENGTYTLAINDVNSDVKVKIYFSEASGEHIDRYIVNAGFGTGSTKGWNAEGRVTVGKDVENSYEGYYACLEDGSISQKVENLPEGKYVLTVYGKKSGDSGTAVIRVNGQEREINTGDSYGKKTFILEIGEGGTADIQAIAEDMNDSKLYLDNFSLETVTDRNPEQISSSYEYFVDCGDYDTDTVSKDDKFGKRNGVTDQIYGEDIRTGYSWGVVTSEEDQETEGPAGSGGVYTTYQWANENNREDGLSKTDTFRYAHGQKEAGIDQRYVHYRFELEPGTYVVTVGMGNNWGNSGNPDVYAGEMKLNEKSLAIRKGSNATVSGKVTVPEDSGSLDIKAVSNEETINMNYISIETVRISEEYEYIVDCGDHNPYTLSEGVDLGIRNRVTDQIYGEDSETGYSWGVVASEDDPVIESPDTASLGAYTKYQRANTNAGCVADGQNRNISFRYAHGQDGAGIDPRYVRYRFELEPGTYDIEVGMGNYWGNAGNPDVYAGSDKLNHEVLNIPDGGNKAVTGTAAVAEDETNLDIYALSKDATINMNYIMIKKAVPAADTELRSLTVTPPDKTDYEIGESLDLTGMKVTAEYSDGTVKDIKPENCRISALDSSSSGEKTITVTYTEGDKEAETTFTVMVYAALTGIEIAELPAKVSYFTGEDFQADGLVVNAVYSDESKMQLESSDYRVDTAEFDSETVGEKKIKVVYLADETKTAEFSVYVTMAVDKTALRLAVVLGESLESQQEAYSPFEEESYQAVKLALDAARTLLETEDADQRAVDDAFLALTKACSSLQFGVQKYGLQAAIEGAQKVLEDEETVLRYTAEDIENLKNVLAEAIIISEDSEADQDAVNTATTNLITAVTSMLEKDTERLSKLIVMAEKILENSDRYVSGTIADLQNALEEAKGVIQERPVDKNSMDEAYMKLAEAISGLKLRGDKTELANAIEKSEEILENKGNYLEASISGLEDIVKQAKAVYDDVDAQQDAVSEAVKLLIEECMKARLMGDVDLNGSVDTKDSAKLLKYVAELEDLTDEQLQVADVNGDSKADTTDASKILQFEAEKITSFIQ